MHGSDMGIYSMNEKEGIEIRHAMQAIETGLEDAEQHTEEGISSSTAPADESDIHEISILTLIIIWTKPCWGFQKPKRSIWAWWK